MKMFGLNCYRFTYTVETEDGVENFNSVVCCKNIHQARKQCNDIVEKRNGKLICVEKV